MACTRDSVGWNGTESIKGDPMPRDATTRSAATQDERGAERKEAPTPAELREHFTSRGHCIGEQLESRSVALRADADHVGSGSCLCALGASYFGRGRRPSTWEMVYGAAGETARYDRRA